LVDAKEEWAKKLGAHKIRLYVLADRKKTIDFWEKNEYKIIETLKNDLPRNDGSFADVVVMEKNI
jgi:hypothetical protein